MENFPLLQQKNKNIRNPNIDFLRIAGMFSIVIDHLIFHGKVIIKYNKYNKLKLLYVLCMWHVSSFGIISGLVGNKKHKFSNLLYLWILVVFYSLLFYLKYNSLISNGYYKTFLSNIFPIIHNKYWYFSAYFGIYPFLPFINSSILNLPKIEIKKCIYFMFGLFIIWSSCYKDCFSQQNGKSPFSLLIFYIFGTYINEYIFYKKHNINFRIFICIICCTTFIVISLISYNIYIQKTYNYLEFNIKNVLRIEINSFPMIIQTFSLVIFMAQIKINSYISEVLTFIGPLTFDVYLIHENTFIRRNFIKTSFDQYSIDLNFSTIIIIIFKKAFLIFTISIFIAYIRNTIFKILKIKNICNNLEAIAIKIINYLI